MAKKYYPQYSARISDSFTPMVETAKAIKAKDPKAIITFIGPCIAKKGEILRPEVFPYVDFVLTFEELASIFVAMDIDLTEIETPTAIQDGSGSGRHYATSGGVAQALKINILHQYPNADVRIAKADSLEDCRKMLLLASNGKIDANLIEGMACPGGCIGGPGILLPLKKALLEVDNFAKKAPYYPAHENPAL
jgi:iron only hydrogenase large subunit-like protein